MMEPGNMISDEKIPKALNTLYGIWFNKWRRQTRSMTPELWDQCLRELIYITDQGNYELVVRIGQALLAELDARARGGYRT